MDALESKLGGLNDDQKGLVRKAAGIRLALAAVKLGGGAPAASIVTDYRLDDGALGVLSQKSAQEYKDAVLDYLAAAQVDRNTLGGTARADARSAALAKHGGDLDKMAAFYAARMKEYTVLESVERAKIRLGGGDDAVEVPVGPRAIEIRFPVDGHNNPVYKDASSDTISHARATVAAQLFDGLMDRSGHLGKTRLHREHAVAFSLLRLAPASKIDIRFDLVADGSRATNGLNHRRFTTTRRAIADDS